VKIHKYLSLSESLEHSLKEVNLIWEDWGRFKGTTNILSQIMKSFIGNIKEQKTTIRKQKKNHIFYLKIESQGKKFKDGLTEYIKQLQCTIITDFFSHFILDQVLIL
jgi:hypothetical protein